MKIRGSHKFVAGVILLIAVIVLGWKAYAVLRLKDVKLDPVTPGRVNIVAVSPQAGYKIIVANQIAYLAKVDGDLEVGEMDVSNEDVSGASRLPLRELMQTMQGDEKALGVLVMKLNDWEDVNLNAKVWRAEDIQKVLDGDAELGARLVKDLNVGLDGVPLDTFDQNAIYNGIVIDSPVTVDVMVGGTKKTLVGRVQEGYQPTFASQVEGRLRDKFNPSVEVVTGIYAEVARPILEQGKGEDVRRTLASRIDAKRLADLTHKPKQVLDNTIVLMNEGHITQATYTNYEVGKNETSNDVSIGLTDPGRMRLWKYSHDNKGFQLLFIVDTIAIAAPRITTELAESNITIRRVPSEDLVADAVALLNEIITEKP